MKLSTLISLIVAVPLALTIAVAPHENSVAAGGQPHIHGVTACANGKACKASTHTWTQCDYNEQAGNGPAAACVCGNDQRSSMHFPNFRTDMINCIQCVEQVLTPGIRYIEQRMRDNVNNFCVDEDVPKMYDLSWQIVHQKNFPLALPAGYCIPGYCIEKSQAEKRSFPVKENHESPKSHTKAYTIKARLTTCTDKPHHVPYPTHSTESSITSKSLTSITKTLSSSSKTTATTSSRSPAPPTISTSTTSSTKPPMPSTASTSTTGTPVPTGRPWQNLPISKAMTENCLNTRACSLPKEIFKFCTEQGFGRETDEGVWRCLCQQEQLPPRLGSFARAFNECAACISYNMIEPKTFNQQRFQGFVDMATGGFCDLQDHNGAQTKLRKLGEVLTFGTESPILFFNITVVTKPVQQPNRAILEREVDAVPFSQVALPAPGPTWKSLPISDNMRKNCLESAPCQKAIKLYNECESTKDVRFGGAQQCLCKRQQAYEWQAAASVCGQCIVLNVPTIPPTEVYPTEFFNIIRTMTNKFCAEPNSKKAFANLKQRGDEFTNYMQSSLKFWDFSIVTQPLNLPTMFSWTEQAKTELAKRGNKDLKAEILAIVGASSAVSRPAKHAVTTIPPKAQACYTSSACNQARDLYNTCINSGQAYEIWDCFCRNQGVHVGIGGGLFGPWGESAATCSSCINDAINTHLDSNKIILGYCSNTNDYPASIRMLHHEIDDQTNENHWPIKVIEFIHV